MEKQKEQTIAEWYRGQTIFITGATGFMGKVLVEKLLYSCPDVKAINILLRAKNGRTPEQRLENMLKLPMFQRLRAENPDALKKIIIIHGDVTYEGLALSSGDRARLIEDVSIIFHCAANLKLEATLKEAVKMNTAGTDRLIQLARQMKKLKAFVHLSTAFCHCDQETLKEKVYECPDDPHEVINLIKWMKEEALIKATPNLISPHPNTYTYTKRLAESLIAAEFPNMPVAIARPSIVSPAAVEPVEGWVDNLNGPVGLLVGAGKGVIRSMHVKGEYHAQCVPVDLAINCLICIAWKVGTATKKPKEIPVYNMSQDAVKRVTWAEVLERGKRIVYENPFEMCIWYPGGDMRSSKLVHDICCIFLHWIPAYFIDFLLFIFGQKQFMVRIQRRIHSGLELLQYFTTREWNFECKNFLALWDGLAGEDRKKFQMDFELVDEDTYLTRAILGARQYCMKEPLSSLPRCRIKQKFLYLIDRLFAILFYGGLIYLILSYSETARYVFDQTGEYVRNVPVVGKLIPSSS